MAPDIPVEDRHPKRGPARIVARAVSTVFAGNRTVWRVAFAAGLPLVALVFVWMIVPRAYYTGTDNVNAYTLTGPIPAHQATCARGLNLPGGTAGSSWDWDREDLSIQHFRWSYARPAGSTGAWLGQA